MKNVKTSRSIVRFVEIKKFKASMFDSQHLAQETSETNSRLSRYHRTAISLVSAHRYSIGIPEGSPYYVYNKKKRRELVNSIPYGRRQNFAFNPTV